jgi:acyl carrier protein
MTRDELRSKFEQIVELPPGSLDESTSLSDLEVWDSVAMMSFIALADEAGSKISARDIRNCEKVGELLDLTNVH